MARFIHSDATNHGRHILGTDPLAVQPYTDEQRDDLVRRTREAMRRTRTTQWCRRGAGGRFLPDEQDLS